MKKIHEDIFALIKKMKDINLIFLLLLMTVLFIPVNMIVFYGISVAFVFIFSYQLYLMNTKISELTLSIVELTVNKETPDTLSETESETTPKLLIPINEENIENNEKNITKEDADKNFDEKSSSMSDEFSDYKSLIQAESQEDIENKNKK